MAQIETETTEMLAGVHRRRLMQRAGFGIAGAAALAASGITLGASTPAQAATTLTDADVLNFALNLEYLESEFYLRAAYGHGLAEADTTGTGFLGEVFGGSAVPFKTAAFAQYAQEIAREEYNHVKFLRSALGKSAVARPPLNLLQSFTDAAIAAGLITVGQMFNPFADEDSFLLGAFIFEDVGVTAYHGAAPLIVNKTYLSAAAGILAVEAYHAGIIRTLLYQLGLSAPVQAIVNLRMRASIAHDDEGIVVNGQANLVDADLTNSIAFARTTTQVINIVTLGNESTGKGGFFPAGLNGTIKT